MFRNNLKIAIRNLQRNKIFSAINILGLAIGIATCLVIMLFVKHELSYDQYHEKADRIVRVIFKGAVQGETMHEPHVMPPTAQALLNDYPEVLEATRIRPYGSPRIQIEEKSFRNHDMAYVDSNFFQVFTIPLFKGDPKTALTHPNSIVISRSLSQKYFGEEDPIGKQLYFKDWNTSYKITGLIDKVPENSHFHFDLFASMSSFPDSKADSWMISEFYTYLVLPVGYDYKQLEAKLPQVVEKYMGPQLQQAMGISLAQFRKNGNDIGLFLQPLTDIHLHSDFAYDLGPGGDIRYVYIFGAIGLFMLLIACINFVNLSTAGATKRAKEVGVRKVLGSARPDLIRQFLVESVLLSLIALILAYFFMEIALPGFNDLSGKSLSLNLITEPYVLPGLIVFGILLGIVAGAYPSMFLASFKPATVLKGKFRNGKKSLGLRSGLVIFQFFISTVLIIGTIVVYKQLHFIQNKKLGYDKEQVLILPETWILGNNVEAFRQELSKHPGVKSISMSGYLPAGPSYNNNFFIYPDNNTAGQIKTLRYDVDEEYIPTLGMKIVAGRNFSKDFVTDSSAIIVNESAIKALGWGPDAIGKVLSTSNNDGKQFSYTVIGVVKDFHFKSLHKPISPLVMVMGKNTGSVIVKLQTGDISGFLTAASQQWSAYASEEPFTYDFLDDRFNQAYQEEQKTGRALGIFTMMTIAIACLGLFGLATFTAEQRTKEVGIRKVLGASVLNVVTLLSSQFLKLVLISNLIAWPFAWWAMQLWLQDFAYRIDIAWWMFASAGVFAMLIAMFTVSFQFVKGALMNPVVCLKDE